MDILNAGRLAPFLGADGARIVEVAGRSLGLVSHSVALITHPAGTASRAHHHTVADEVYVVRAGRGLIDVDGVARHISAGDVVVIRPGEVHKVACEGAEDLELLVTCSPAYEVPEVVWDE